MNLWLALFLFSMSLSMIDCCSRRCNGKPGPGWTFFGRHAFAVYLIHSIFVMVMTKAWIDVLRAQGINTLFPFGWSSPTSMGSDGMVFLGWLFMVLSVNALVWPTAWLLRMVPGVARIV